MLRSRLPENRPFVKTMRMLTPKKRKSEYEQPSFDIDESMLHQMLPDAIRTAAATFPAGTGLGHDHISPRCLIRLSGDAIAALAKLFMAFERRDS